MSIKKLFVPLIAFIFLFIYSDHCFSQDNIKPGLLEEVNKLRAEGCKCGNDLMPAVPPVKWDDKLEKTADLHAHDMIKKNYFSHIGSDKSEPADRATRSGYQWSAIGENIAKGQKTVSEVVLGWKNSPAHCHNIMDPEFKEIGAVHKEPYWVLVFGTKL